MQQISTILERRKEAKDTINFLNKHKDYCLLIHYSCESFYDNIDGNSSRITSIAVRYLSSGQTKSFSIHQVAEIKGIESHQIHVQYDILEKIMLDEFYKFVKSNLDKKWIHWNMRDINYGFEALEHRYKKLKGKPHEIPITCRYDLARILIGKYGVRYIGHPRLEKLVEYNRITNRDFLSGENEAKAFENKEYVKLHQSTLRKVDILSNIFERATDESLKTLHRVSSIQLYFNLVMEKIKNHWVFTLLGIIASGVTILLLFEPNLGMEIKSFVSKALSLSNSQ